MATSEKMLRATSVCLCIGTVILWLGFAMVTAVYKPHAIEILEDFDVELPALTIYSLRVMGWPMITASIFVSVVLVLKEFLPHLPIKTAINLVALLLGLLITAIGVISLYLPHVKIMQSVM